MSDEWGGYWTQVKLDILRKYLIGFNRATKAAGASVYLDLFAGALAHVRPDTGEPYEGSPAVALRTIPEFDKLVFWELEGPARKLRADLQTHFSDDPRHHLVIGDCNANLELGLAHVTDLRWAPAFAFLDPKGLQVAWKTISTLASWRSDRLGRKVEQWVLFPEPALARVLGLQGVRGQSSAELLTRLFGNDSWVAIHQRRRTGSLGPAQMRAEFVNLIRWQLQHTLGYKTSHALQLGNVNAQPVYTLVFATDVAAGDSIMRDVYAHAMVHEIPMMRSQALAIRHKQHDDERGISRLFPMEGPSLGAGSYDHSEPWTPLTPVSDVIELDEEPEEEDESEGEPE